MNCKTDKKSATVTEAVKNESSSDGLSPLLMYNEARMKNSFINTVYACL